MLSPDWVITFGPFRVSKAQRLLERDGEPVPIGDRTFDVLVHLLERAGHVVSHCDLLDAVWQGMIVDAGSLRFQIRVLRKVLGDEGAGYIVNVPRRGYCFTARTKRLDNSGVAAPSTILPIDRPRPIPRPELLIGRASTISELAALASSQRIVNIIGAGGMGKTSVAISAAHQLAENFRDGACFVELGVLEDPARVTEAFAVALGLPVRSARPVNDVIGFLHAKQMLILVDCCEHLIDETASLIEEIVAAAADLHILATSREALRIDGERLFQLEPLASPPTDHGLSMVEILGYPALQLFMERAGTVASVPLSEGSSECLVKICNKLDGLPLAIELAAPLSTIFGLDRLTEMLEEHSLCEWPGRRTAPPRHQTIGAMLDWSYKLLTGTEKQVLRYLSVFRGTFDLEAALAVSAVGTGETETAATLANLVLKSLLSVHRSNTETRYRLLDTTRSYVLRELAEAGETNDANRRHAEYYASALTRPQTEESRPRHLRIFAGQIGDISAAISWAFSSEGDAALAVKLVVACIPIWRILHLHQEAKTRISVALSHLEGSDADPEIELALREGLALATLFLGGYTEEFTSAWTRVLSLAEALRQPDRQAVALLRLWAQHLHQSNVGEALEIAERFQQLAATGNASSWTSVADWYMGVLKHHLGDQAQASIFLQRAADESRPEAIAVQRRLYGYDCRVSAMAFLSNTTLLRGDAFAAVGLAKRALDEGIAESNDVAICTAQLWGTFNFMLIGNVENAEQLGSEVLDRSKTHALSQFYDLARACAALVRLARGDESGLSQLETSLIEIRNQGYAAWARVFTTERMRVLLELGRGRSPGNTLEPLNTSDANFASWYLPEMIRLNGRLAEFEGDAGAAEKHFLAAIQSARPQSSSFWELRAANDLARLWISQGRTDRARPLLEEVCSRVSSRHPTIDYRRATSLLGVVPINAAG